MIEDLASPMSLPCTILIKPSVDGGYFVGVLELRGCMTQAETQGEVFTMIEDVMKGWLSVALDYGDPVPEPQPMHRVKIVPA